MPDHPADAAAPEFGDQKALVGLLVRCPNITAVTDALEDYPLAAAYLLAHGLTIARDAPSEAGLEAARRAATKWDCEDTKRWLIEKWRVSPETAQAMIGEGLRDLGGSTGIVKFVEVAVRAYLAAERWRQRGRDESLA